MAAQDWLVRFAEDIQSDDGEADSTTGYPTDWEEELEWAWPEADGEAPTDMDAIPPSYYERFSYSPPPRVRRRRSSKSHEGS